jgi:hypothetical protein
MNSFRKIADWFGETTNAITTAFVAMMLCALPLSATAQTPTAPAVQPPAASAQTAPASQVSACVALPGVQSPEAMQVRARECSAELAATAAVKDTARRRDVHVTPLPSRAFMSDGNGRRLVIVPDGTRVIDPDCVRCVEPVAPPPPPRRQGRVAPPAQQPALQTCAPSTLTVHFWQISDIHAVDDALGSGVEQTGSSERREPGTPTVSSVYGGRLRQAANAGRLSRVAGEVTAFGQTRQAQGGMIRIEVTSQQRNQDLQIPISGNRQIISPNVRDGLRAISFWRRDWGDQPPCGGRMNTHVVFR